MTMQNWILVMSIPIGFCIAGTELTANPTAMVPEQQTIGSSRIAKPGRALIDIVKTIARNRNDTTVFPANAAYSITVQNSGRGNAGKDSMFIVDRLPGNHIFFNGSINIQGKSAPADGPPIVFEGKNSGLSFDIVRDAAFSDRSKMPASFDECNYVPVSGYDPAVRHICLNPKGVFAAGDPVSEFTVHLRTKVWKQ